MMRTIVAVLGLALQAATLMAQAVREGYVTTPDSLRLFYRVVGSRGDTIVAIHGGPGVDLESIAGDFVPLTQRHVVIFYDQRGAGRSSLPDTSRLNATTQIQDLEAVRQYFHLDRMTLVAHSYGPLLAATYALAHPDRVRRMVFLAPVPPRREGFWERFRVTMGARMDSAMRANAADAGKRLADPSADTRAACRDYWAIGLRPRVYDPDRNIALVKSDLCASAPEGIRYGLTVTNGAVMGSYGAWDLRQQLATLQVPTLVIHGEEDAIPMDLVQLWATWMPRATLVRVSRAAHMVYAERPDVVWPRVEEFLARP
ncbi:MAG TPA: alpha/beta hydrolase [Gemmatimonadaceae bacterium]|nr:alpha/beta hydrolase [Gemmatimonadaceae bacterium]